MPRNPSRSCRRRWTFFSLLETLFLSFLFKVDRLEDELVSEQEKYKAITEELEQTFAEMSGY